MRYVVCFGCGENLPVPIVVEGAEITCNTCGSVVKLVKKEEPGGPRIYATKAGMDTTPKVVATGFIKLTAESLALIQSDKPCIGDYDPNEVGCDECEDLEICKEQTPRVKVRRRRI